MTMFVVKSLVIQIIGHWFIDISIVHFQKWYTLSQLTRYLVWLVRGS